ncbi:YncE family protein [Psychroflexus salis]|uniref:Quinoprotein amine dehydrogenase n=1 Tax=Psychroflexus salis TaxID=1526574 RepID=A0A916ZQU4_9FLAO|nr:DUF5074 domain-containing protein [Psychroflexus salis]GGE07749.1 hypothetical protein GCM10010831_06660 [Psychroflexus salis]
MKYFKYLSFLLFTSILLTACSDDDDFNSQTPIPTGDYADGFFVVNEGPFGGTGSLSFIKNDFSEVTQNAFVAENPNEDLGSFIQSVFFDEERMFIISNGSNLINVVNRYTLEFIALIDAGFEVPRYGTILNNKAYVTNLASFGSTTDDFVSVINLETYQVENTIPVNNIANQIEAVNGKLIVENSAFSDGNSLTVIDAASQEIESLVEVGAGLNSMVLLNNEIFTLSATQFSRINTNSFSIDASVDFNEEQGNFQNLQVANGKVYYTSGNAVYFTNLTDLNFEEEALFSYETDSAFGMFYGFAVQNNQIYIADGSDFASNGTILVYNESGQLLFETEAGLGPNGFYFN